jgi:hypothetical protein
MQKLFLYSVIVLLFTVSCDQDEVSPKQADKFVKYYGGLSTDHGNDVKQLPDGGYFIVGTITVGVNENTDAFRLITDKYGNSEIDIKTFGGPLNDKVAMMQLLPDGGAAVIGTYQRTLTNSDIWIMRFDNRGDTLWTRTFGTPNDDEGYALLVDSDKIICTGYITESEGNVLNKQIWMYALYHDGNPAWPKERDHGYNKDDEGTSILKVEDGLIVVGTTNGLPFGTTSKNIALLKTDVNGLHGIMKAIGGEDDEYGKMIQVLPDGNLIILGTSVNITSNNSDIIISKVDASINELSEPVILDGGENETASSFLNKNNRIHILGTTVEPRTDSRRILLIIAGESGENPQYFKYGFKNEFMEGFGMDYTSDGGLVFTGSSLVLFKIKETGEL